MSRREHRARRRRERIEEEHARTKVEIDNLLSQITTATTLEDRIAGTDELIELMKRIAKNDNLQLWSFFTAELFGSDEGDLNRSGPKLSGHRSRTLNSGEVLTEEEIEETEAMIADLIAPNLGTKPPRWVRHPTPA